jgi:hypothetical protein
VEANPPLGIDGDAVSIGSPASLRTGTFKRENELGHFIASPSGGTRKMDVARLPRLFAFFIATIGRALTEIAV